MIQYNSNEERIKLTLDETTQQLKTHWEMADILWASFITANTEKKYLN
jgi:hypothetical protein